MPRRAWGTSQQIDLKTIVYVYTRGRRNQGNRRECPDPNPLNRDAWFQWLATLNFCSERLFLHDLGRCDDYGPPPHLHHQRGLAKAFRLVSGSDRRILVVDIRERIDENPIACALICEHFLKAGCTILEAETGETLTEPAALDAVISKAKRADLSVARKRVGKWKSLALNVSKPGRKRYGSTDDEKRVIAKIIAWTRPRRRKVTTNPPTVEPTPPLTLPAANAATVATNEDLPQPANSSIPSKSSTPVPPVISDRERILRGIIPSLRHTARTRPVTPIAAVHVVEPPPSPPLAAVLVVEPPPPPPPPPPTEPTPVPVPIVINADVPQKRRKRRDTLWYRKIAELLNKQGFRMRNDGPWTAEGVRTVCRSIWKRKDPKKRYIQRLQYRRVKAGY